MLGKELLRRLCPARRSYCCYSLFRPYVSPFLVFHHSRCDRRRRCLLRTWMAAVCDFWDPGWGVPGFYHPLLKAGRVPTALVCLILFCFCWVLLFFVLFVCLLFCLFWFVLMGLLIGLCSGPFPALLRLPTCRRPLFFHRNRLQKNLDIILWSFVGGNWTSGVRHTNIALTIFCRSNWGCWCWWVVAITEQTQRGFFILVLLHWWQRADMWCIGTIVPQLGWPVRTFLKHVVPGCPQIAAHPLLKRYNLARYMTFWKMLWLPVQCGQEPMTGPI